MAESLLLLIQPVKQLAISCGNAGLLGFPTWYKYLDGTIITQQVKDGATVEVCQPMLRGINDVWLVVAAIIELLLRIGTIITIGFIIWGGIRLIVSQGDPGNVKAGRETIQNAVIGLVIMLVATGMVHFVAGRF